ncbi:IMP cyclohydrolase [Candidatus Kaiserbacteria bacterium]|nr:IMP cyclohydrolase [Candidatus Kaiserbacteria bacterium]
MNVLEQVASQAGPRRRVLVSVTNKDGIAELARALVAMNWEIISTGGTADTIRKAGVPVTLVSTVTNFPEILDGRVKTLHPNVHGGILANRSKVEHMRTIVGEGIEPIDMVIVNLYNFEAKPSIEEIDIGGPAMLRSAAKNAAYVIVIVDPVDYEMVLKGLASGDFSLRQREALAYKVFRHTADYDNEIAKWMANKLNDQQSFL